VLRHVFIGAVGFQLLEQLPHVFFCPVEAHLGESDIPLLYRQFTSPLTPPQRCSPTSDANQTKCVENRAASQSQASPGERFVSTMRTFDILSVGIALTLCTTKIVAQSEIVPVPAQVPGAPGASVSAVVPAASAAPTSPTAAGAPVAPSATRTEIVEVKVLAPDHLVMSSGSILVVRGNQTSRLESELRLTDGSVITPGGTVKRLDGSTTLLADGQAISPAGKLAPAPISTVTETTPVPTRTTTIVKP
jgi:hypothetical protein